MELAIFLKSLDELEESFDLYLKSLDERIEQLHRRIYKRNSKPDAIAHLYKKIESDKSGIDKISKMSHNLNNDEPSFHVNHLSEEKIDEHPNNETDLLQDGLSEEEIDDFPRKYKAFRKNLFKDWNDDEIGMFYTWLYSNSKLKIMFLDLICDFVVYKYKLYLSKFDVNSEAKAYLIIFIKNRLAFFSEKKIDVIGSRYKFIDDGSSIPTHAELSLGIYDECIEKLVDNLYIDVLNNIHNRFIQKEINGFLRCLMSVIDLKEEHFKDKKKDLLSQKTFIDSNKIIPLKMVFCDCCMELLDSP